MNEARKLQAMQYQSTVFAQLLKALPRGLFERLAKPFAGGRAKRRLSDWNHLVAMVFAQASGTRSLRDLQQVVERHDGVARHVGLAGLKRSTLSDANRDRPAGLFEAVARQLAGQLAEPGLAGETVRLIDATHFLAGRRIAAWSGTGGVKLHMMYELESQRPVCFATTPKRLNDIVAATAMAIDPDVTYVFDKGYYHFAFWAKIDACGSRFVTRLKRNSPVAVSHRRPVSEGGSIVFDQVGRLNQRLMHQARNPYDKPLRVIGVTIGGGRQITLISNDLDSSAEAIAGLYKKRWQIELFFKWIKQNLKLKHFLGISRNAVIIQIMAALIACMLMRIATLRAKTSLGLQAVARLMPAMLLARRHIGDVFKPPPKPSHACPQLSLWPKNA
jgi:hypothetical protein